MKKRQQMDVETWTHQHLLLFAKRKGKELSPSVFFWDSYFLFILILNKIFIFKSFRKARFPLPYPYFSYSSFFFFFFFSLSLSFFFLFLSSFFNRSLWVLILFSILDTTSNDFITSDLFFTTSTFTIIYLSHDFLYLISLPVFPFDVTVVRASVMWRPL